MEAAGRLLRVAYNGALIPLRAAFTVYALQGRARGFDRGEFRERLGWIDPPAPHALWVQAASVGEVGVAIGLTAALRRRRDDLSVLLTTTTRSGRALAQKSVDTLTSAAFFPLDFAAAVRRALARVDPSGIILIETEIWPNLLRAAAQGGVRTFIANGRISDRAFRRYLMIAPLIRSSLREVRWLCVQSSLDAERFERLGARPGAIEITGNMKFATSRSRLDSSRSDSPVVTALSLGSDDELWIGASTAEGEEEAVMNGFDALPPLPRGRRVLVLAPRRPERFDQVGRLIEARRLGWVRRSALQDGTAPPAAWASATRVLLDTLGELSSLYPHATVAFVGGSLAPIGGHNIIEPASQGVAPIFGPHVHNFRDASRRLLEAGGAFQVHSPRELADLFLRLANDPGQRAAKGKRARAVVAENTGALDATVRALLPHLESRGESPR